MSIRIVAFYRFIFIENPEQFRATIREHCAALNLFGVMLVSSEGLNATMAGSDSAIEGLLTYLEADARFSGLIVKEARAEMNPFYRLRVRLKKEIVALGVDGVNPNERVGTYIAPKDWNALIQQPDITLIDVRNDYEIQVGTFEGAVNPQTDQFRSFASWVEENLDPQKTPKVAMFCTGGIRCEKATSFMMDKGFEAVYHLQGGILQYFDDIPMSESLWHGECFVFDQRIAVNHQLEPGETKICYVCSYPISESDEQSPHFIRGVSCPRCHDQLTIKQLESFMERQKQMELAKQRSEVHLGMSQRPSKAHAHKAVENLT